MADGEALEEAREGTQLETTVALNWSHILTLATTSGIVAGLVNQIAGAFRDKWVQRAELQSRKGIQNAELAHQIQMQTNARHHADEERRDAAHSEARGTYLPFMVIVERWLRRAYIDEGYAADADYIAANVPPMATTSVVEIIDLLHKVSTEHPTRWIREAADRVETELDVQFNVIALPAGEIASPTADQLSRWMLEAARIIEALHDPRPLEPVK